MERWLIHWPREYEARPWPFGEGWRSIVDSSQALPGAASEVGLVSMCDGATERPHVPANLPRLEPKGHYKVGIYHNQEAVYVLASAVDAPAVISHEEAERRAGKMASPPMTVSLFLMAVDSPLTLSHSRLFNGEVRQGAGWQAYGPRVPALPTDLPELDFHECVQGETYRCGWRLPKRKLGRFLDGRSLRLSLMWQSYVSLELAVWGSSAGWGIRQDEMIAVRLVDTIRQPLGPVCRQAVLAYDPNKETGSLEMSWEGLYGAGEELASAEGKRRPIHSDLLALRVNGRLQTKALATQVSSEPFLLVDGPNHLHISTAGGEPVAISLEKRGGNSIAPCTYSAKESSTDAVMDSMHRELDGQVAEMERRQASNGELNLIAWPLYAAASCGRFYHYLEKDPRCLDAVRDVADRALALQREDGTFGGYHLGRQQDARKEAPAWAGGAYDSGQAGELWCVAAWLLKDERYLEASQRLLAAYSGYRIEFNQNFAAFALYHLVAHYRLTRETVALDEALFYCRTLVATKILPLGYQGGHNYYTVYGFITLRGMALLCQILPLDHPHRPELRELCLRMANQLLSRLQPDGTFDSRDRYFVGEKLWLSGLFSVAPLLGQEDAQRLDMALQLQLGATPNPARRGFLDSEVIRYLAMREELLAGKQVDLLARL